MCALLRREGPRLIEDTGLVLHLDGKRVRLKLARVCGRIQQVVDLPHACARPRLKYV